MNDPTTGWTGTPSDQPTVTHVGQGITRPLEPLETSALHVPPGYVVLGELGRGGMGVVYRARHVALNREVALKMILAGPHAGQDELVRFRVEAEAIARVNHPGIVAVFDVGEHQGHPFFSLEFCPGGSLDRKLRGTPLAPREAASLVERIARAMDAAHEKGVVHRDLKPGNVLMAAEGSPKVTDFGLARKLDEPGLTQTGAVMGTPSYMAPEQAEGKPVGPLADVYSLGAILYECLTGRPPFRAATIYDTIVQVLSTEPVAPRAMQPAIPRDLETICLKCLAKAPAARYPSAHELAEDLRRHLAGEPIRARAVSRLERGWRWCRRNPMVATLAGSLAVLLVAAAVVSTLVAVSMANLAQGEREARDEADRREEGERLARVEATQAGEAFRRQLARQYLASAERATEAGDLGLAMLWLTQALELDQADEERCRAHRLRLTLTWQQMPRLTALLPHTQALEGAEFSRDGSRVVTASYDRTARLWDPRTSKPIGEPMRHDGFVMRARFSPDGTLVATACADGTVRLWDGRTARSLDRRIEMGGPVWDVTFSPDGKRLAATIANPGAYYGPPPGIDNQLRDRYKPVGHSAAIWDLSSDRLVPLPTGKGSALHVAFSADGRLVALAGFDNTQFQICDSVTGKKLAGPFDHAIGSTGSRGIVVRLAFSPDGKRVVTRGYDDKVRLWDAATGKLLAGPWSGGGPWVSPDGTGVLGAGLHDLATGKELFAARGDGLAVAGRWRDQAAFSLVSQEDLYRVRDPYAGRDLTPGLFAPSSQGDLDPDARFFVLASQDGLARIFDRAAGWTLRPWRQTGIVMALEYARNGRVLVSADANGTVELRDPTSEALAGPTLHHAGQTRHASLDATGQHLVTACSDGVVRVWRRETGLRVGALMPFQGLDARADFLPSDSDYSLLLVAGPERTLQVRDWRDGRVRWQIGKPNEFAGLRAVSTPDGRRIVVVDSLGRVHVHDRATGKLVARGPKHPYWLAQPAIHPSGSWAVTAGGDHLLRAWDVETGRLRYEVGQVNQTTIVTFCPDGTRLATSGRRGDVRILDIRTGKPVTQTLNLGGTVAFLDFSADGRWLLAGLAGGTARLFDARTGEVIGPALPCSAELRKGAFSPDGRQLALAGNERMVIRHDLTPDLRSLDDWRLLATVYSGRRLENGIVSALSAEQLREAWSRLRKQRPEDVTCTEAQVRAFEWREMLRCRAWNRRDWKAALDRALASRPDDPALLELEIERRSTDGNNVALREAVAKLSRTRPEYWPMRARLDVQQGRAAEALREVERRLGESGAGPYPLVARAILLRYHGRHEEAIADLTRAIDLGATDTAYRERGNAEAARDRWERARADFVKHLTEEPGDLVAHVEKAWVDLALGDRGAFHAALRPKARLASAGGFEVRCHVAWMHLLTPQGDRARAAKLVTEISTRWPRGRPRFPLEALLAFRMGKPADGLSALRLTLAGQEGTVHECAVLALCHARTGMKDEGRRWLERARDRVRTMAGKPGSSGSWPDRVAAGVLLAEADRAVR